MGEAWRKPEKVVTFEGRPMLVPEPYSIYKTPSGGRHVVFRQPDPPIKGRFRWSEGVEILANCLLTVHDVGAILYPSIAPRAVLPDVFRRPYEGEGVKEEIADARSRGHPINKVQKGDDLPTYGRLMSLRRLMRCLLSTLVIGEGGMMNGSRWPTPRNSREWTRMTSWRGVCKTRFMSAMKR